MPDPGIALAAPAAVATAAVTVTRRALLARRRRGVLGHLDQLRREHLVLAVDLGDEREADPAAVLVDLDHHDADDIAASHPVRTACYLVLSLPEFQLD